MKNIFLPGENVPSASSLGCRVICHIPGIMRIWTLEHCSAQNTIHRSSDSQMHTVHEHFMQTFTLYMDSDGKYAFKHEGWSHWLFFSEQKRVR